jgi:ATP-dependent DNA helicase
MAPMLAVRDLTSFGAPSDLVEVWESHVREFTDIQERAIRTGALGGQTNLLVVAPTSSGKTLVGELAATTSAYTRRQHAIFIVPYRALADEHYDLFRQRYSHLLSVVISTSDWTEFDADIYTGSFNLAVMTYEKLMGFLVQQPDLIRRCTALIVDEVQTISQGERGAKLELLLTQVMLAENPPQIIALSASLDDVNRLDTWLKATLVSSSERPIPLTESVCEPSGSVVRLGTSGAERVDSLVGPQTDREALVIALTCKFLAGGMQVIVFRSTVRNVLDTARQLRQRLPAAGVSQRIDEQLNALDDSDVVNDLRLCLACGIGFHSADLTRPERRLAEEAFRSGEVRVLVATTTLAMGVNLPCDVVIIADSTRRAPARIGWSVHNISVSEYRNAAGRAGRLGQRSAGYAVLVADNLAEQRQLVHSYLLGTVEPVASQIPHRRLADVVFDIVCAQLADSPEGIVEFIAATFAYLTFYEPVGGGFSEVRQAVTEAVRQCLDSGLVAQDGLRLYPTQAARVFGAAGLSLASAVRLASLLEHAITTPPSKRDLIWEIASCEEVGDRPWPQRRRGRVQDPRPRHAPDGSDSAPGSPLAIILAKQMISADEAAALVRAKCLLEWMSGKGQRAISSEFQGMGAAAARIRELGKNAAWLLDALAEAARMREAPSDLLNNIHTLALEGRYGLPAPLAPLARLGVPGISREQLLGLYQNSRGTELHDPETVLDADDSAFEGLLTPLQVVRLRQAILADIHDSIRRKRSGHIARAEQSSLPRRLIEDLYTTHGGGLEQAVTDALNHAGLSAARVLRQPHGEEDIRVASADGTLIISVTASQDDARPIRWNKAKEILGAGAGLNPVNYICVGRPSFESLAERSASNIAREAGKRSILLVPIPVFAEAIVRISEGRINAQQFTNLLAHRSGTLTIGDIPDTSAEPDLARPIP